MSATDLRPTDRKRKPRAVKAEATTLHSKIVRHLKGSHGCQNGCGRAATDCAHIIVRVYSHTRTDIDNAYALCATCHREFTNRHGLWMDFVDRTIGRAEYDRLDRKAQDGVHVKFDWYDELDRLRAIARELGIL